MRKAIICQHSTAQHSTADKTGIFFRLLDYNSKRKGHLYPIRGDDASVLFRYNGWFFVTMDGFIP